MARPRSKHPTDSELEVLEILWRTGSSTLREIHDALRSKRDIGLTTTLKKVQIMVEKGLVLRDEGARPASYTAARGESPTRGGILKNLVRTAFGGSARQLLMQAVEEGMIGDKELHEAQKLVDAARKDKGARGS